MSLVSSGRRGRESRLVSRCRVELDRPRGRVIAETEDISRRGLFVRTELMIPVGEEIDLEIELPDGMRLTLRARVAHQLDPVAALALGRHAGMGFELIGPETAGWIRLRAHYHALSTELGGRAVTTTTSVIVVEPHDAMRARLVRSLEVAGFKVTPVTSATEALAACAETPPDTIVASAHMEGMTGIDLAYAMSEHASLSDVPLVLVGDDSDLGRLEAFRAGVHDYIPKPFLDEELVIRIHRAAAPLTPRSSNGLRGSLTDIGLGTLLSLFEFERKSGVLLVLRGGELARVFVADGRVLKVEGSGSNLPKERMMRLLDWRDGHFEFSPADVGGKDELQTTVTSLLLEHARRRDETLT